MNQHLRKGYLSHWRPEKAGKPAHKRSLLARAFDVRTRCRDLEKVSGKQCMSITQTGSCALV